MTLATEVGMMYPYYPFSEAIEVNDDRDIDYNQRWLERLYSGANTEGNEGEGTANSEVLVLDYKSCEMIADELYDHISNKYPGRSVKIQVAEDGENGCDVEYNYE